MGVPIKRVVDGKLAISMAPKACFKQRLLEGWEPATAEDVKRYGVTKTLRGYDVAKDISLSDVRTTDGRPVGEGDADKIPFKPPVADPPAHPEPGSPEWDKLTPAQKGAITKERNKTEAGQSGKDAERPGDGADQLPPGDDDTKPLDTGNGGQ